MTVAVSRSRSRVEKSEAGRGARRAVEEDPSRERRHRHATILLRFREPVNKVCPNGQPKRPCRKRRRCSVALRARDEMRLLDLLRVGVVSMDPGQP